MLSYQTWVLSKDARMLSTCMWGLSKDRHYVFACKKIFCFFYLLTSLICL